ncbi:MAG: methyl-accepting chemotaxis protein [Corticimicrobacter sp.]|uniref:methyl-accepting chemotaxis protein n=1 Tax=Corticimicrobacter sp. TaxID=2678536 RepID=UPI0032DB2487
MKNMSIRSGLITALLLFLLVVLGLGLYARFQIAESAQSITTINQIAVEKQLALEKTFTSMMRARLGAAVAQFAREENRHDEASKLIDIIGGHERNARRYIDQFAAIPMAAPEGQALSDTLAASMRDYLDRYVTTAIAAIKANDVQLLRRLQLDTTEGTLALNAALERFNGYTQPRAEALVNEAAEDASQAQYILIAAMLATLLLAVLIYVALMRVVIRPLDAVSRQLERIAGGDLSETVEAGAHNEIGRLRTALGTMQQGLLRLIGQVRNGVHEIHTGAQEITMGNTDLSSRTEQQAASLEETAASMEQLASTVKQNADNAQQANTLAGTAAQVAQRGGTAVGQVVSTMRDISQSSQRIGEIVSVIDGIAFQTNILALNAAVEAARAGEQGKGFAVVASEVRTLAQRSASAAREIKELISTSISTVQTGSQQVESAGETMDELVNSVRRVADIVGEIAAASGEQAGGIDQVNQAVTQMDQVTQQNAALVEQAAAAAGSLEEQARQLQHAIGVFRLQGDGHTLDATPVLSHRAARKPVRALPAA